MLTFMVDDAHVFKVLYAKRCLQPKWDQWGCCIKMLGLSRLAKSTANIELVALGSNIVATHAVTHFCNWN